MAVLAPRLFWRLAAGVCTLGALLPAPAAAAALADAVKANFLYKFAPFVQWPSGAFASAADPIVLCTVGSDPVGAALDEAVRGVMIEGRRLEVRELGGAIDPKCHILFLPRSVSRKAVDELATLAGKPMLIVSDDGVENAPSVIQFVLRDGRVRFNVDLGVAAANHLTISSKLLSLGGKRAAGADVSGGRPIARLGTRLALDPGIASVIALALIVVSLAFAVANDRSARNMRVNHAGLQAEILSASLAAPLAFDDRAAAREFLNALRADPEIDVAGAYDPQGRFVAGFARGSPAPSRLPATGPLAIADGQVRVTRAVEEGGVRLGSVYLVVRLEPVDRRITRYIGIGAVVLMASLLVAFFGSTQRAAGRDQCAACR